MITSRNNPKIIQTCSLRQKKNREQTGLYLLDGTKLLREAIKSHIHIEEIFATASWIEKNQELLSGKNYCEVSSKVMQKLSSQKSPEGVVAVAGKAEQNDSEPNRVIFLENIQDPGNMGTIIRTADAFGYSKIIVSSDCADIYNEKTLRASMGSIFHLTIKRSEDFYHTLKTYKENGFILLGTSLEGEDLNRSSFQVPEHFGLILGNESNGMSSAAQELCSQLIKIPILGGAESLNVSVAAGILLFLYSNWE